MRPGPQQSYLKQEVHNLHLIHSDLIGAEPGANTRSISRPHTAGTRGAKTRLSRRRAHRTLTCRRASAITARTCLDRVLCGEGFEPCMGRGTWSWIVPDGLWEIAKPLIPPSMVRPQGGGTQDTPDETLFATIIYVLVSGCACRQLPPCFGISKSTAHRRFLIWSRAGVWGRLHEAVLHRLDDVGLVDVTRVVLDTAHVRARKGANTQVRAPWTRASRAPRCTSCRTRTDCPSSWASQPATPTTAKA